MSLSLQRTSFIKIFSAIAISCLIFSILSCSKSKSSNVTPTPVKKDTTPTVKPIYSLVWSDEFNGTAVDTSKWTYDLGNLNVNNEKEFYQTQNATVSNGNLVITAKKEAVGSQPYTSARLKTLGKFTQTYGRIEASIKLPMGMGMWPAFWMLGANINTVSWPQCGELDIMEHINKTDTIYGTMHWNNNGHVQYGSKTTTTPGNYHLYAIEWDANEIRWYVDSTLYQTGNIQNDINNTGAFHLPFFILLNLAVAGDFPGQTVDETLLPESMYVDYVRVYKQTN
jgi:beta-glucanase (GH16 family)